MRHRRRGLTVLELLIILLVIGLIIFFVVRMRGGEEASAPAPADTTLTAEPLAPGEALAVRLGLLAPLDSIAAAGDTVTVRVRATGATGAAVANAAIRFDVDAGNGQVAPRSATTNDVGEAEARWVLGSAAGEQRLRAAVAGNDTARVVVTVTATAAQVTP